MVKNYFFLFLFTAVFFFEHSFAQTETEPNNKFEQCNPLTFDAQVTGTVNKANDSDFYCIQVSAISVLNIAIDQITGNAPITIHVFNPDKTYLGVYSGSAGGDIHFSLMACSAGTYYFMLYETSKTMSGPTYRLQITTNSADQYECNNLFATATSIGNTTPVTASIDYDNDEDYFSIDITQSELLTVTVNPVPSTIRMGLALYDQNRNQLIQAIGSSAGSQVSISKQIEPGKYYIRLRSENISFSASPYSFTTTHSVITFIRDREQVIELKAYPNPTGGNIVVQLNGPETFAYCRLFVYDDKGKAVYSVGKPAGIRLVELKTGSLPAGVYRLQLMGGKKVVVKQFVIVK